MKTLLDVGRTGYAGGELAGAGIIGPLRGSRRAAAEGRRPPAAVLARPGCRRTAASSSILPCAPPGLPPSPAAPEARSAWPGGSDNPPAAHASDPPSERMR